MMTDQQRQQEVTIHEGFIRQFTLIIGGLEGVETLRARLMIYQMRARIRQHEAAIARLKEESSAP